ncbi:hypothetical protein SLA2020_368310 [Shorea laevis]
MECDVGEADARAGLQYGKESFDQGNKFCLSNGKDVGVRSFSGKGMLKTCLWAWKRELKKARFELDRVLRKILEGSNVLGCFCKFGPFCKAFWVGRFIGRKAWAPKSRSKSCFRSKPIAVVGSGEKHALQLGIGVGPALLDGASWV